jgi:hypothetical protein
VVLFDPLDPGKIYTVLRAADGEQGQAVIDKERARIAADYDPADDESRIRSQRGSKENILEGLKISGRYMTRMQSIFREEGLPAELAYLPLVESSFNVRARSSVGAVGMWQFMPETGETFKRVDTTVDERRDPMASSRAAARLLKENYRFFGNWPLAITAYNHGTDGILRGIKAVESDDLVDLIRGYQSPTFRFASKSFYAEFLAVVEIATNSDNYFPSEAETISIGYRVKWPPHKVDDFILAQERSGATAQTGKAASIAKRGGRGKIVKATVKNSTSRNVIAGTTGRTSDTVIRRRAATRPKLNLAAR